MNASYLLDLITVFPNAKTIRYSNTPQGMYKPLVLDCEEGDALLLTIRTADNNGWTPEEVAKHKRCEDIRKMII